MMIEVAEFQATRALNKMGKAHKAFKCLEKSIEQAIETDTKESLLVQLLLWLKVLEQMEQLESDKYSLRTALSNIYQTLWKWTAELWNEKNG